VRQVSRQRDKVKPSRWKFSIRTLALLVALLCGYLACWGPTTKWGIEDVSNHADRTEPVAWGYMAPSVYRDASVAAPLVVGATGLATKWDGTYRRRYYFWFFGYVVKLPYEQPVVPSAFVPQEG